MGQGQSISRGVPDELDQHDRLAELGHAAKHGGEVPCIRTESLHICADDLRRWSLDRQFDGLDDISLCTISNREAQIQSDTVVDKTGHQRGEQGTALADEAHRAGLDTSRDGFGDEAELPGEICIPYANRSYKSGRSRGSDELRLEKASLLVPALGEPVGNYHNVRCSGSHRLGYRRAGKYPHVWR